VSKSAKKMAMQQFTVWFTIHSPMSSFKLTRLVCRASLSRRRNHKVKTRKYIKLESSQCQTFHHWTRVMTTLSCRENVMPTKNITEYRAIACALDRCQIICKLKWTVYVYQGKRETIRKHQAVMPRAKKHVWKWMRRIVTRYRSTESETTAVLHHERNVDVR
jgi:hypothetical protein